MDEKDKIAAYTQLATFRLARRDARNQILVRMSLGLWAVLAAGIIYLKVRPPEFLFLAILLVVVLGHALVVQQAQLRSWQDANTAFYYIDHAENVLFSHPEPRPKPLSVDEMSIHDRWLRSEHYVACIFWISPTILLALAAYFLVGQSS